VTPGAAASPTPGAIPPPVKPLTQRLIDYVLFGGLLFLLVISFQSVEMERLPKLFTQSGNMKEIGTALIHPDFTYWKTYVAQMWLTVQIAIWGTALAVIIAIPFGLLASKNITPPWIQQPVRRLMDLLRSIPDLVLGTLFLVAVGLGPFAGVMALMLNTGGVLAKLFSEAVESIDKGPVEGVRATGAAPLQEIVWGVLPQVAPLWTSYALYRFESNSRSATVLGLIGAGGIGQLLFDSLNGFNYSQVAAIAVIIVVAVSMIDLLSQAIRSRLL
jgi:phosphonate transport system permease protein